MATGPSQVRQAGKAASAVHPVALRVMRVYQPALHTSLNSSLQSYSASPDSLLSAVPLDSPMLPPGFGVVHAGQAFSVYIVVLNQGRLPVSRVTLTASITPPGGDKTPLPDVRKDVGGGAPAPTTSDLGDLPLGGHGDTVVTAPVPAPGQYVLEVVVQYQGFHGEAGRLRKRYPFPVSAPFVSSVSALPSQLHASPVSTGTVVTSTLRNVTPAPLCLRDWSFECAPLCHARLVQVRVTGQEEAQAALPSWAAGPGGAEAWAADTAVAKQPVLFPGHEAELSFMVLRHLVASEGQGAPPEQEGVPTTGLEVARHATPELGHVKVVWGAGLGQDSVWTSTPVSSAASAPQVCHLVAPTVLHVGVDVPTHLALTLTNLPRAGEPQAACFNVRACPPADASVAVLGQEVVSTGSLAGCGVASHTFSLVALAPGTHRVEVMVSRGPQDAPSVGGEGAAMLTDCPIAEGQRIAWHTVEVVAS